MADSIAEIRKIFRDKDVPLDDKDVWDVQGVIVVKHKALERLAVKLDIDWREPKILRCEADEAVILVMGGIGSHVEWSVGEARIVPMTVDSGKKNKWGKPIYEAPLGAIGNYQITPKQAAYPWAMAEKRGKDRVIIKLAGIDAYSEEESDDFKDRPQTAPVAVATDILIDAEKTLEDAAQKGTPDLKAAWAKLPPSIREGFGGVAPKRLKELAAEHDKRKAA